MSSDTIPTSHLDLLQAPIPVTLATIGPTGHPQLTHVWAIIEDGAIVISLPGIRQKLKNLRARPLATVFVADPSNPFRTLEVRADITIEPDPDLVIMKKILDAYGADLATLDVPTEDRVVVTLHPIRVVATG